jgi:hypothetical protein
MVSPFQKGHDTIKSMNGTGKRDEAFQTERGPFEEAFLIPPALLLVADCQ